MTKLELLSLISLGFLIFLVLFIRIGFFFGVSISPLTLLLSFVVYIAQVNFLLLTVKLPGIRFRERFISLSIFIVVALALFGFSYPVSQMYDLSWDGQGYHQTAIIALTQGWNPVTEPSIALRQTLQSQIFAEGYPSALWEMQAAVYAAVGKVNAGKVLNVAVAIISFCFLYTLLRNVSFGKIIAAITGLLIVLQPVYLIQLLTYMQDGFGYQLLIIALCSLLLFIVKPKTHWPVIAFFMAEILLVSTKYSHLPVAFILWCFFALVLVNRFLNKEFFLTRSSASFIVIFSFVSIVFMFLPYIRNTVVHGYPLYPTNYPELMGAVTYNNVPRNLSQQDKLGLLFYGMFSQSQSYLSGDPTSEANVALLKIPFTFSLQEIRDAAGLFNNRVGAGGPLYSGLVAMSLALLIFMSFQAGNRKERYAVYSTYLTVGLILLLSLLAPTPNLFRYTNQLQLVPFAVLIPLYAVFYKKTYIKVFAVVFLTIAAANIVLYGEAVLMNNIAKTAEINAQFANMKQSGQTYQVRAQHFYSNYILLEEHGIPFAVVNRLNCARVKDLVSSSNTTHYCLR